MGYDKINSYTNFYYVFFRNVLLVLLPVTIIIGLILSIPHSSANTFGSDNVTLNLSTSCTVNAVVTEEHVANLHGGQIDNNVGITKLSAFCNDNNGYSIYAIGSSNNIDGNTDLVNAISESYNIRTGVYDDTLQTNPSSWAMKLTAGTGTGVDPTTGESVPTTPPAIVNGYNNYSAIPNIYTQVAKRTSGTSMTTDTSISGSYLETTYQIYANSAQPSGTYNGAVKYLMVHPNSNNTTITFEDAFAGAGKQPVTIASGTYYKMQDMASDICSQVAYNTTTELLDIRDNSIYWITKLKDNHCWMTQNLDLDLDNTKTYTHWDTDLGWDTLNENTTWKPSKSTIGFTGASVPGWQSSQTVSYSADPGDIYYYTSNSDANDIQYGSLQECTSAGHTDCTHYHAGNYYNWIASMAGTSTLSNGEVISSICPAGWRLPSVKNNEFGKMLSLYNVIADENSAIYTENGLNMIRKAPLYFVRPGSIDWNNNKLIYTGISGSYCSGTVTSAYPLATFSFNASSITPANYNQYQGARQSGYPIRCIAR